MNDFMIGWRRFWKTTDYGPKVFVGFISAVIVFTILGDMLHGLVRWMLK